MENEKVNEEAGMVNPGIVANTELSADEEITKHESQDDDDNESPMPATGVKFE